MSGRLSKARQEPLGPDETFSALVTRLIIINRVERAAREKISPTLSALPDASGDGLGESRRRTGTES
jgi:hypothetical protein